MREIEGGFEIKLNCQKNFNLPFSTIVILGFPFFFRGNVQNDEIIIISRTERKKKSTIVMKSFKNLKLVKFFEGN